MIMKRRRNYIELWEKYFFQTVAMSVLLNNCTIKHQWYSHLPPILLTILVRRSRFVFGLLRVDSTALAESQQFIFTDTG